MQAKIPNYAHAWVLTQDTMVIVLYHICSDIQLENTYHQHAEVINIRNVIASNYNV